MKKTEQIYESWCNYYKYDSRLETIIEVTLGFVKTSENKHGWENNFNEN